MNIMKKNVLLLIAMSLFAFSSVTAQSFLKKVGDAAKKGVQTDQGSNTQQAASKNEYVAPVVLKIESTRIIGDKLLISGKIQSSEDLRLMGIKTSAITPDGDIYESKEMWWGGAVKSPMSLDVNMVADINYSVDYSFEVKSKTVTDVASLTFELFNHTAQQRFKISLKDIKVPSPVDANLADASVIEISKNVYLRWTKAEETAGSFKLSFIVENKDTKDQSIRFLSYSNAKFIDNDGTSYDADLSLKDNVNFPAGTPVAGSITVNKPLKLNQISLLEFSSQYFKYKVKKIVVP
jgi:hypothetical protein